MPPPIWRFPEPNAFFPHISPDEALLQYLAAFGAWKNQTVFSDTLCPCDWKAKEKNFSSQSKIKKKEDWRFIIIAYNSINQLAAGNTANEPLSCLMSS